MNVDRFKKMPLLGILRGVSADVIEPLFNAVSLAGLESIEIAMNTDGAAELIRLARAKSQPSLMIGAGTVTSMDLLKSALDAGASFIVMPAFYEELVVYCCKNHIPVFPGALTPHEIDRAYRAGATMVKVFPAKVFGPQYFKEIKGPFNEVELLACGGVNPENLAQYFACGASAVAIGSSVFKKELLLSRNFGAIEETLKKYIKIIQDYISHMSHGTSFKSHVTRHTSHQP